MVDCTLDVMEKTYDQLFEENESMMNEWEAMLMENDQPFNIERATELRLKLQTNIIALSTVANPMMQQRSDASRG